jgi:Kef-type K+ transport system membrane component KefB
MQHLNNILFIILSIITFFLIVNFFNYLVKRTILVSNKKYSVKIFVISTLIIIFLSIVFIIYYLGKLPG